MRVPSRSKWIILKWFHGISWAENLSTDCCACLNWAELARTALGRTALVFSQKLEQIIYLAIHTHTHRYTERWRVDSRKGIAVGWKTRTLISPRRLQLTSGIKLAQFLLAICIASTHTHMFEVWVSGSVAESGWLYITTTKSTEQRASGVGESKLRINKKFEKIICLSCNLYIFAMKCQIPEAAEAPLVRSVLSNMLVVLIAQSSLPAPPWPSYDLCIWEEQSKCNHLNMYLHIVQECGFSYLRWLLLFNQIRTHIPAHPHTHTHGSAYIAGQHVW